MKKLILKLFLLLFGLGQGMAQSLGTPVTTSGGQSIAENGFKAGILTVRANFSTSASEALITVTFPQGMHYDGNLTLVSGLPVQEYNISDTRRPVFKITGVTGASEATFSIAKKVTPQIMQSLNSGLRDEITMSVDGNTVAPAHTDPYILKYPVLAIEGESTTALPTHENASGTSSQKFRIKNTGDGIVKDIYFAVQYPAGITGNSISYEGMDLSPVATFTPAGTSISLQLYKVSVPTGVARNGSILVTENYTVTGCDANRQNKYFAMWGSSQNQNDFYQTISNSRTINVESGTPNITIMNNGNETYFTWIDGLGGNEVGQYNVTFLNNGSGNATAYDVLFKYREYSWIAFDKHQISDLRIVATDGTEIGIPIPTTPLPEKNEANNPAFRTREIPLRDISELNVASLAGKNIGLSDIDGDGYADDWPKNAKVTLRFKLKKVAPVNCLLKHESGQFSINPIALFDYKDACAQSISSPEITMTAAMSRTMFGILDSSKLPDVLSLNQPRSAYLIFGNHSYSSAEREQGKNWGYTPVGYTYQVKLPPNLSMKNVRLVKKPHYSYDDTNSTDPAIKVDLPDVAAGTTFSHTFTSTTWEKGYIAFDLELVSCTGVNSGEIEYTIYHIDSYGKSHQYAMEFVCSKKQIAYDCPDTGCNNAPRMVSTKTERAENSYGWKDWTMNERMQRSDYTNELELSRALYLDDIEVTAEGEAQGNFNDLYYHWEVKKGTRLMPKSLKFTIMRGGVEIVNQTLQANSTFPIKSTENWSSEDTGFLWNLTPYLPSDKMRNGDQFKVVATYQLTSGAGSKNTAYDVQSSNESYFYTHATNKKYCGVKQIPTFYVAGTYELLGTNTYNIKGCVETAIGANQVYMARRSNTAGTYFSQEFRPGRLIKDIKLTYPSSYKIVKIEYEFRQKDAHVVSGYKDITSYFSSTDNGTNKVYTFTNPTDRNNLQHLHAGEISVENDYNATLKVTLQASCGSKTDNTEKAKAEINYYDYYYHYAANGGEKVENKKLEGILRYSEKPGVALTSVTPLTLRVNTKQQEVEVELNNSSLTDAPYTWLSIPDVQGVKVLELIDSDTNTPIVRQTGISGESMFFLSEAGLAKGAKKKYKIRFEMTNCADTSFDVYAGWNCSEYPIRGYQHTCNENKVTYTLNVVQSVIQITPENTNPGVGGNSNTIAMCSKTPYKYIINSAGEGNIEKPKVVIVKEAGLLISDFVVTYPYGSSNNYTLTPSVNGNLITYDLSGVVAAGNILPGSIAEGTENNRRVGVAFNVQPDCDFVSGSSFDVDMTGFNICGNEVEGDKNTVITAGIIGVVSNQYKVDNVLKKLSGNANYCVGLALSPPSFAKFEGKHVITREPGATSFVETQPGGEVIVRIPKGFEYVPDTFVATGKNVGATFSDPVLATTPITSVGDGETELHIAIPAGMQDTNFFTYTIEVRQKANFVIENCAVTQKLKYYTVDKVSGIPCGTMNCPSITVETSRQRGEVVIPMDRAELRIKDIQFTSSVESNKERVNITYKIENTSSVAYTGNLVVTLFDDVDNNGNVTDAEKVQDFTLTNLSVPANTTSVQQTLQILLPQDKLCRLHLAIRSSSNPCLCNEDLEKIIEAPTKITGLVSDFQVCEGVGQQIVYNVEASDYEDYKWEAVTPGALAYLSSAVVKNPIFTYSGSSLSAPLTVTYTLTVRRTNGCEATQTVTVTVKPSPAFTVATPQNFCDAATVLDLKKRINATAFNTIKVYSGNMLLNDATPLTHATTYQATQTQAGQCESVKANVLVNIYATPSVPVVQVANAQCGINGTTATITNYDSNFTYTLTPNDATLSGNTITGMVLGTSYTLEVRNGTCTVASTPFQAKAALAVPTPPVVTNQVFCASTDTATFVATPTAGHTLRWYDTATSSTQLVATPTVSRNVTANTVTTKYVSQVNAEGCESGRVAVTITIDDTQAPVIDNLADLMISCEAPNIDTQVSNWLSSVNVTDACGVVATITNNYSAVKPMDLCNVTGNTITVTITATDTFGNISTKTAFVRLITIDAVDDDFGVQTVGTTTKTVFENDKLNGVVPTSATVSVTSANLPIGVTLNSDGTLTIGNTASSGTHTFTYTICDKANTGICDTATATVTIKNIDAVDDDFGVQTVGTTTKTVFENDKLNGVVPTSATVSVTSTNLPIGVTLNSDGTLTIGNTASSGTHTFTYTICDKANTGICDTATATITIKNIDAVDDDFGIQTVGTTTKTVFENDRLNGNIPTSGTVSVTPNNLPIGVTLNSDGTLTIGNTALSGTHTFTYTICDKANTSICDTATATVTIKKVVATDDSYSITDTTVTQTVGNVLDNDKVGTQTATTTLVTIGNIQNPMGSNVPALDTNGNITIPQGTLPNIYTITYEICLSGGSTDCDTAEVQVVVGTPTLTVANDTYTATTIATPRVVGNVLSNDAINGHTPVLPSFVNIGVKQPATPIGAGVTPTLSTITGDVEVPANTPAGVYTIVYELCPKGIVTGSASCKTATVTVTVTAPTIVALPNTYTATTTNTTQTVGNVFDNDSLGGVSVSTSTVILTPGVFTHSNITMDADGNITISPNTPSGTYTGTYTICDRVNASNCTSTMVTIVVTAVTTPTVVTATDDVVTVTTTQSGTVGNVLDNDKLGTKTPTTSDVTITVTKTPTGTIVPNLDPVTGNVTVPSGTPSGTYEIGYKICTKVGTVTCSTATVTITVTEVVTPTVLIANDDPVTVTTTQSGTVVNVLDNDKLGTNTPTTSDVTITVTSTPTGAIVPILDPSTGNVMVPSGTPTGTYTIGYKICTKVGTVTCSTATVTITVTEVTTPTTPTLVTATDDPVTVTTTQSGTVVNVLDNDKLGTNTPTTSDVTITVTSTPTGAIVPNLDPVTGNVMVPSGTPTGTYTIGYRICTKSGTITCDTATVTVIVTAVTTPTVITATDDPVTVTTTQSGTVVNVLDNDRLGTKTPTTSDVTITVTSTPTGTIVPNLDPVTGNVTVPSGTPTGTYTIGYSICTKSGTITCATATVVITVTEVVTPTNTTVAKDDFRTTYVNTQVSGSVAANDLDPEGDTQVWTIQTNTVGGHSFVLNADGTYTFTPSTDFVG
ncbi:beta strand repeat-containing protein, partial [Capnocytophaga canis]|uniref:beta strand repeat-containing protein n=1 Tax=Capnocytophaga canis TaxID=1848903 RepID=UPI0037D009BC